MILLFNGDGKGVWRETFLVVEVSCQIEVDPLILDVEQYMSVSLCVIMCFQSLRPHQPPSSLRKLQI